MRFRASNHGSFFYWPFQGGSSVAVLLCSCVDAFICIMKTRLFKYIENFTTKKGKFSDKTFWYFTYSCSKHKLWVLVRTALARRYKIGVYGAQNYIGVFSWWWRLIRISFVPHLSFFWCLGKAVLRVVAFLHFKITYVFNFNACATVSLHFAFPFDYFLLNSF